MEKNIKFEQNTPLWDNSLSIEERLDYLTGAMTLEEKIHCLTTGCPDIPRLGIRATYMGGEAAHGIEARHDQAFNKRSERSWKTGCDNILPAADRYECILGPGADQAGR
mgnify:CR=1 FL=1